MVSGGLTELPSKCPQNPFASTESLKRNLKIAQFVPEASSFGTEEGKESESAVTFDMAEDYRKRGPNNLLN